MLKELKINKTYTISIEHLYKYYVQQRKYDNTPNTMPTFFGFEINHSQDGVSEGSLISFYDYYDIINPKTGEIICMDGETIRILNHEIDCYTLISEESNTSFKLSQDEVNQCIFGIE